MPMPWETPYPGQPAANSSPEPWNTPYPGNGTEPSEDAKSTIRKMVETSPGIKDATNWFDAFQAGTQMSAEGLMIRGGKPADYQVPANASFGMKLMQGIGGFAGDLPIGIVGAVGGAAAGGAGGTVAAGPVGGAIGAPVGGGAGAFALPEAVRQAALDAYQLNKNGAHMTASDIFHMAAHSSWETGKAAAIGAVSGVAGKVAEVASPVWKSAASMAAFSTTATSAQAALNHKLPDQADVALTVASTLGFGLGAHYVGSSFAPKLELTLAGDAMAHNLNSGYRQTGLTPNEIVKEASADPKKNDELYGQDVNGDPVMTKFNQERPEEAKPFKSPQRPANGLVVARQMPDGTIKYGQPGDMHFNLYGDDELEQKAIGSVNVDQKDMGFAQPDGPFMSREDAAKFVGQPGRLESVKNEAAAAGEQIPTFGKQGGFKTNAMSVQDEHDQQMSDIHSEASIAAHVEQLLPQIRGVMGAKDDAISPEGAVGRYQIQPGTARQYGFDPSRLKEPAYNEQVARTVLADLSRRFNGDTEAIIHAYNYGPKQTFNFIREGRDATDIPTSKQAIMVAAGFGGKGGEPPPPPKALPPAPAEGAEPTPEFLRAQAEADYESQLGEQPKAKQTGTGFVRQMISELESARGIDRQLIREGLLDPTKDLSPSDMFRQTYASDDRTQHMIMRGNIDPITFDEKPGTSLLGEDGVLTNLKEVGGNMHDFDIYRVAQRTVDLAERGNVLGVFQGNRWLEKAQSIIDNPAFKKYEAINAKMQMWKRGFLEYGRDSGILNQKQLDAMEAASSHVSVRRIMGDDNAFTVGGGKGGGFRVQNPLKRMEGSDRQIISPLTADIDNARMIIRMADRNRAVGNILSIPSLVKSLALRRVNVSGASIAEPGSDVFNPYGMTPEQEASVGQFAHMKDWGEKGSNQFTYFNKGKRETWEADSPEIAELMRGIDNKPSQITIGILGHQVDLMKAMSLPAKLERAGIIGAFDFPLRVFQKHALTAWQLDPLHPPPIITGIQGMAQAFAKGEGYYELMRKGGMSRSVSGEDVMDQINKVISDQDTLTKTNALQRGWNVVATPLHFMQAINETLATAERIGYVARAKKMGIPDIKAATMSRSAFLDFQERAVNSIARMFAQNIPFFKSAMLGLKFTRDGIVADPKGFASRAVLGMIGAQVGLYALNRMADKWIDDPTQRFTSQPQWVRDQYPFQTPPLGPNGTRIKLGSPYVIGPLLTVPVERMLQKMFEDDPHAADGLLEAMVSDTVPGFIPASVRPILEEMTNHNFFTGQPMVSDSLKSRTADEQYTDNTSQAAIDVSRALSSHRGGPGIDISPIVIDNFVTEWTGTWGAGILKALNAPLGKSRDLRDWKDSMFIRGFVIQNPRMSTKQLDEFYKDADGWNRLHADAAEEIKKGDPQGIADKTIVGRTTSLIMKFDHALNVIRTASYAVEDRKDMNVDEKRQLANQLYQDAWRIATTGSKLLRGGAADNGDLSQLNDSITSDVEKATPNVSE